MFVISVDAIVARMHVIVDVIVVPVESIIITIAVGSVVVGIDAVWSDGMHPRCWQYRFDAVRNRCRRYAANWFFRWHYAISDRHLMLDPCVLIGPIRRIGCHKH